MTHPLGALWLQSSDSRVFSPSRSLVGHGDDRDGAIGQMLGAPPRRGTPLTGGTVSEERLPVIDLGSGAPVPTDLPSPGLILTEVSWSVTRCAWAG